MGMLFGKGSTCLRVAASAKAGADLINDLARSFPVETGIHLR